MFLGDENLYMYMEALEISMVNTRSLFKLLDFDNDGRVDIDEFCEGCLRLRGEAKSFDIHCLMYENQRTLTKWKEFMKYVETKLEVLAPGSPEGSECNGPPSQSGGEVLDEAPPCPAPSRMELRRSLLQ